MGSSTKSITSARGQTVDTTHNERGSTTRDTVSTRRRADGKRRAGHTPTIHKLIPLALVGLVLTAGVAARGMVARSLTLSISAEAAIAVDLETGQALVSKHEDTLVYPASLTKLMTAMLLAENRYPGDLLKCSVGASLQEPTTLGLKPGSVLTAAAAMDALLVASANDVAYMVAEEVGGTAKDFVAMMNAKAKSLGMVHTHFVNPAGLHDQNHYSTAKDLAILFKAALKDPWVAKALGKAEATITASAPSQGEGASTLTFKNTNPLLGKDGCVAGKTGHTAQAGKCLAALYEKEGHRIVAVVLKSPNDDALADDMDAIVKAAWQKLQANKQD